MPKTPTPSEEIPRILFLLLLSYLPFSVNSQANHQDRSVLLNLKQHWGDPPSIASWDPNINGSHCSWTGVTCTEGRVTGLSLSDANITTSIPPSICDLDKLTDLDLSLNYIPGKFPTVLYNCPNLQTLNLSQNSLVGPIPADIDRIPRLAKLDIGANNFSGDIPPAIGRLPAMTELGLYSNLFNGTVPREIGNLSNLAFLRLAYNPFAPSRVPVEFGALKKLVYLWMVETNLIGEIPVEIGGLVNLEHLDLSLNDLSGNLLKDLFLFKNLTNLYVYGNRLSGEIPSVIESLKLKDIDLSMNKLSGSIPEGFGKLRDLRNLVLYDNQLTGEIPESVGFLPFLTGIRVFKNGLSGKLPPELGLHSKLEELQVSENRFSGNLPENLCAGNALVGFVVFSNNFTGELPRSLGGCDSLITIEIYKNRFYGEVPTGIWSLSNLSMMMISHNMFSGELPNRFGLNLSRLEMSDNMFSGRIPAGISGSTNLTVFVASNNNFSGEIPLELTGLSRLSVLSLDQNQLSGQIPSEIISWNSLTSLNLSSNQLQGAIPPALGSLPSLNVLDLSENQLTGEVPTAIGQLRLSSLNLSSNRLVGRIPVQFDNLAYDTSFLNNPGLCADNALLNLPICTVQAQSKNSSRMSTRVLAVIIVLTMVVVLAIILIVIKYYSRTKHRQDEDPWKLTSFQRLDFTEASIVSSLTENNLIGSGGSGKVYRVHVSCSNNYVAVKKIWSKGRLEKEFLAEVQILATIRHFNVLKLLCCISNETSKFLVYEYMENGSLDQWLHVRKSSFSSTSSSIHHAMLDWPKRLQIAAGAAQGLCYMHHSCSLPIIHRDIKSSNILLDSDFNAKVADFGLAKILASQGEPDSISVIAGSFGYMAPEYAHTTKVNEKIDVYSFGVVLLELVTGREASNGGGQTCLAEWAWSHFQEDHSIESALDEEVMEACYLDEMSMIFKLGLMCTSTLPSSRPAMKEVSQILLRYYPSQKHGEKKVQTEYDAAPLLSFSSTSHSHSKISSDTSGDRSSFSSNM
ncbi:hypothetical protein Sjap_019547 [Stephania japonica]|uniref:Protein kinase domain-containing protein n=1 Tax=Stephania japonica TaxID=461633 RepID=A0AAP0F698_9MAGN